MARRDRRLGPPSAPLPLSRFSRLAPSPRLVARGLAASHWARGEDSNSWRDDIGWCRLIRKKAAEQDVLSLGRKPVTACAAPSRRVCDHRVTTGQTAGGRVPPRSAAVRRTGRPPRRTGEHLLDRTAAATWPVAGYGHRKVAVASELRFCRYVLAVDPEADCADGSKEAIRHRLSLDPPIRVG
jgi:hypothetical protein